MRTLIAAFRNLTLQYKLLYSIIPLLLVTVGITGLYTYFIASKEVVEKIRQSQLNMAIKTKDQLDYFASNTISFSNYLFLNPSVQAMVTGGDTPAQRDLVVKNLLPHMVTGETIQSLLLYSFPKGDASTPPFVITQTGIAGAISYEQFKKTPYYDQYAQEPDRPLWQLLRPSEPIWLGDYHHKIALIKTYKSYYDYRPHGMMVIGMDSDKLSHHLFHDSGDAVQFIMNDEGFVVAATDQSWTGKPITRMAVYTDAGGSSDDDPAAGLSLLEASDKHIVSESRSDITGWRAVVIQDRSKLVAELQYIRSVTLAIMIVVGLMTILLTWVIARIITSPMKRLMLSMRALQSGDFSQRVHIEGNDEIARLGHLYNTMVGRIKLLIDDVYASSLKQREAELKALQSQINPHFLYNTLNMINWSAMKKGDREISDMVISLSQVFRLSLNNGNEYIDLGQELELVRHYLSIQKKRYPDRLAFDIELEPDLDNFRLPKLLLQPLVENVIVHAVELSESLIHIHVTARHVEKTVVLEVTDNGPGMSIKELERLKSGRVNETAHHKRGTTRSGMALANIRERLALYYGHAELDIESKKGIGTRVRIRIDQGGIAHVKNANSGG